MPSCLCAPVRLLRAVRPAVLLAAVLSLLAATAGLGMTAKGASAASTYLEVSAYSDRSAAVKLDGAWLSGKVYVFVAASSGVTSASFWIDDPATKGAPAQVEDSAPWDLGGGTPLAKPWDLRTVPVGAHTVTVVLTVKGKRVVETATLF